jgi:hypothetical protein
MKQIVDEDVSDIMSHLVARRKNSIAKYVQTWVAICAPLLVAITTLEEKDKDEGNRLNWEKAMKEFDTEAMVFLNEMTILFEATANDRFHFCFNEPARTSLKLLLDRIVLMMGTFDPSKIVLDMFSRACRDRSSDEPTDAIEQSVLMDDGIILNMLGTTRYAYYSQAIKMYNKTKESRVSGRKRCHDDKDYEADQMELEENFPM